MAMELARVYPIVPVVDARPAIRRADDARSDDQASPEPAAQAAYGADPSPSRRTGLIVNLLV
jgi:hypothetical protein